MCAFLHLLSAGLALRAKCSSLKHLKMLIEVENLTVCCNVGRYQKTNGERFVIVVDFFLYTRKVTL